MRIPPVTYLAVPDGHVGWQSWGVGDPTILLLGEGFMSSVEDAPDQPRYLRWIVGLADIGRVLRLDPPGVGTSDSGATAPTLADWADAGAMVLDAAGVERATVVAAGASTMTALRFVERHPDRVSALVLINGTARAFQGEDYPHGVDTATLEAMAATASDPSVSSGADADLMIQAPSAAQDPEFRSWWGRVARRNARPRIAGPINAEIFSTDLRDLLPAIRVPTLVVARRELVVGTGMTRVLADGIPGARYVELPGPDMLPFLGDVDGLLDEVREHLTGERHAATIDRVFAAVLFTDLVGSTTEVVKRGDGPWRSLLLDHGDMVRAEVARHGGRLVQDLGDGTLCTFPVPGAAIRCALAMVRRSATHLGVEMRAGLHAGEVEMRGQDLAGINVHTAARVSGLAQGGEVLVSTTVVDLVAGSPFAFEDRGLHELKGVPGARQVWAVREA
ncbi:MAG: adenylate/guanylate cyclase domain-containing protein [Nocardioides sp.]